MITRPINTFVAKAICVAVAITALWWYLETPSRVALERAVVEAMGRQDLAAAEAALLRIRPRDFEVLQVLADVAYRRGRNRDCVKWLERVAESSKRPAAEFVSAGTRAFEFGLPADAERLYRRAITSSPPTLVPYSRLARLYLAWRRGDQLRRVLAEADAAGVPLSDDPTLIPLWVVGDRIDWHGNDSLTWLELVCKEQPQDGFAAAALVRSLLESKQYSRAHEVIDRCPANGSPPWPVAVARAALALDEGRHVDALAAMGQLPVEAEQQAETWFLRGRIWLDCGDVEGALLAFEHAAAIDLWHVNAIYNCGRLLARLGRFAESEAQLNRAAEIDGLVLRCTRQLQSGRGSVDLNSIVTLADKYYQRRTVSLSTNVPKLLISPPPPIPPGLLARRVDCSSPKPSTNMPKIPGDIVPIQFVETTAVLGVRFAYEYGHARERWLMETLGGGVAVLDYDRDGWPDLFFAQGGKLPVLASSNSKDGRLWRNLDGKSMVDATDVAGIAVPGYAHGCAVGDVNNDGFPDLLVCRYGGLTLMNNQGDGTWADSTNSAGLTQNDRWNTSAAFADLDGDGDLDLYIAGYCDAPFSRQLQACIEGGKYEPCRPNAYPPGSDTLLINSGDGRFDDRSRESKIADDSGFGLGVVIADFDDDGLPEIFVGNDTTQNFLWHRHSPSGMGVLPTFEDRGLISGVALDGTGRAEACMGIACGDVDGDAKLDLFVTNFFDETCTFYHNLGGLGFEDRTGPFGLSNAGRRLMGWGCQFLDADNDGWLDLWIVNGHLHDTPQLPQFYRNRRGTFFEQSSQAGNWFTVPKLGRSVATWDYNRDGRIDVVASHQAEPASILRNETKGGQSVTLTLVGTKAVRDAAGACVRGRAGGRVILRLVSSQGGYLSACSSDVIFGLGTAMTLNDVEIVWPNGMRESFGALNAGHYVLREGSLSSVKLSTDQ